jgi:WD40-like Beta Propeller Repeat
VTGWHEPAPGEREAVERSWEIVREAFEERLPAPRGRDWRPFALAAVAAAVVAAALSPPGHAVFGSLRDAVHGEKNAKPALFSLPVSRSRLLVNSAEGAWVVQSDGSKRLLEGYREASWSPHGLYLAGIRGDELRALEPNGDVHWSIGRAKLAGPVWSSRGGGDERVAYLSGSTLRVIGGDGRGDRIVARHVAHVAPAWRPRTHVVAYADGSGKVVVRDADTLRVQWTATAQQRPAAFAWSADGEYLLARGASSITVFSRNGKQVLTPLGGPAAAPVVDAAFMPGSHAVAFVQDANGRSVLWFYPRLRPDATAARRVFAGAGSFDRIAWSPDGRWILLSWASADQWLFIRSAAVRRVVPVSGISDAFGPGAVPAGWCCP